MFILAGLESGCIEGADKEGKEANYRIVQQLADEFVRRNGSLICAELLGLAKKKHDDPVPEVRTEEYYKKRPCAIVVEEAAEIIDEYIKNELKA